MNVDGRAVVVLLFLALASCAHAPDPATQLEACSLTVETACIEYASTLPASPATPHGRLVVGLAARAAELPDGEAAAYHRRIVELVDASEQLDSRVARSAAASHLVLARLSLAELDEFGWKSDLNAGLEQMQTIHARVEQGAAFSINHGDPKQQGEGAWLIASGYFRQAELLGAIEIPRELTAPAEIAFREKLEVLANTFREEGERFRTGLLTHCERHSLATEPCTSATTPPPRSR